MKQLVTAIMPTTNRRRRFIPAAIELFRRQTWPKRELVIIGEAAIADLIPNDPMIRFLPSDRTLVTIGVKRNAACREARGDLIVHWDDDDWYRADRIEKQVAALQENPWAAVTGESSILFFDERDGKVWRYQGRKDYVIGTTLCYRQQYWKENPFQAVQIQEDNFFVGTARAQQRLLALRSKEDYFVARIHKDCTSPKLAARLQWFELQQDALPGGFSK